MSASVQKLYILKQYSFTATAILSYILFLFIIERDQWDGLILELAHKRDDFSGVEIWFRESGWYLQYLFSKLISNIASVFDISWRSLNDFICVFLLAIGSFELRYIFKKFFKIYSPKALDLALSSFWLAPAMSGMSSSVLVFYLFCMVFGIFGVLLYLLEDKVSQFIGLSVVFGVVSLKSLVVFIPTLYFAIILISANFSVTKNFAAWKCFLKTYGSRIGVLCLMCVSGYSTISWIFPMVGLYENYNILGFKLSISGYILNLLMFATYLVVPCVLATLIAWFGWRRYRRISWQFKHSKEVLRIVGVVVLIGGATLPYVLVGKSHMFLDSSWDVRHGLLLSFPIAIMFGVIVDLVNTKDKKIRAALVGCFGCLLTIFGNNALARFEREFLDDYLAASLGARLAPPPGTVLLCLNFEPKLQHRSYELTNLFFDQYGRLDWWVRSSSDCRMPVEIPAWINDQPAYRIKFGYLGPFSPTKRQTHTIIDLRSLEVSSSP